MVGLIIKIIELSLREEIVLVMNLLYFQLDQLNYGTVTVHAKLTAGQYGKVTYTITDSYQAIIVDNPSLTTSTPAGTLVFDSTNVSSYPPSMKFPDNQKL